MKKLSFHNIKYSIGGEKIYKINDMELEPGCVYLISGESGSGKTTFINVVLGFVPLISGRVTIGDSNNQSENWLSYFSVQFQNHQILNRNLVDNISMGGKIDQEKLDYYIKMMRLESLNSGICFGNRGEKISGGEKRRIAIARALYRSAFIYIFDEPTNDLDQEMVSNILQLIEEKKPGNIVIMASHDPRVSAISDSTIHF